MKLNGWDVSSEELFQAGFQYPKTAGAAKFEEKHTVIPTMRVLFFELEYLIRSRIFHHLYTEFHRNPAEFIFYHWCGFLDGRCNVYERSVARVVCCNGAGF